MTTLKGAQLSLADKVLTLITTPVDTRGESRGPSLVRAENGPHAGLVDWCWVARSAYDTILQYQNF